MAEEYHSDNEVEQGPDPVDDNEVDDPHVDYVRCLVCDGMHPFFWHCSGCGFSMHWHICCECCQEHDGGPGCDNCNCELTQPVDSDNE